MAHEPYVLREHEAPLGVLFQIQGLYVNVCGDVQP